MQRIEAQDPEHTSIALKILAWVSYAFRSLSLGELQHALAIEAESTRLDEEDVMDGNSITALCAGLVVIDQGTNTVTLVHYTAKKYFEDIRANRFPGFHAVITLSCATYLHLSALGNSSIWMNARHHPLACYAAQYMDDHARQNPEDALDPSILDVIGRVLSHPDKRKPLLSLLDGLALIKSGFIAANVEDNISHAVERTSEMELADTSDSALKFQDPATDTVSRVGVRNVCSIAEERDYAVAATLSVVSAGVANAAQDSSSPDAQSQKFPSHSLVSRMPEVTALHLAASMGLAKVPSLVIKESGDIDEVDDTGKTALAVAMERGFEKAVEFMINSGANVDLGSEHGQGIFLLVAESKWESVADIIGHKTRSNFSPKKQDDLQQNAAQPLLAAYDGKYQEISDLVTVRSGLGVPYTDVRATALFVAVERQHLPIAEFLLKSGVDVNSKDSVGQTPLHRATHCGHGDMVRFLLSHDANVDCKNDDGRTPWSANVRGKYHDVLKLLLDAGANPSTTGHQGVSELYIAAQNGETSIVKFMLESGTGPILRFAPNLTGLLYIGLRITAISIALGC